MNNENKTDQQTGIFANGWRPIETAHREQGLWILLRGQCRNSGEFVAKQAAWNSNHWEFGDRTPLIPTHWQPLPSASLVPAILATRDCYRCGGATLETDATCPHCGAGSPWESGPPLPDLEPAKATTGSITRPANWSKWSLDPTPHDWPEDAADEDNGQYQHICKDCGTMFIGNKRRPNWCKVCCTKATTDAGGAQVTEADEALQDRIAKGRFNGLRSSELSSAIAAHRHAAVEAATKEMREAINTALDEIQAGYVHHQTAGVVFSNEKRVSSRFRTAELTLRTALQAKGQS